MIQIIKYLFFLVLGIILFVLYNSVNNFSVGVPPWVDRLLQCATGPPAAEEQGEEEEEEEFNIENHCAEEEKEEEGVGAATEEPESGKNQYTYYEKNIHGHTAFELFLMEEDPTDETDSKHVMLTDKENLLINRLFDEFDHYQGELNTSFLDPQPVQVFSWNLVVLKYLE